MSTPKRMKTESSENAASLPDSWELGFGKGPRGWIRASTSFLGLLTMLVVGTVYLFSLYRADLNDPDIWWHMRDAQYLLEHHQFIRQDMYSFTVAGHAWVNTEWLSEIPYYAVYHALGLAGLKSFMFSLLCVIFLLLLYLCYQESRNFKASALACYGATVLATVSFGPRTILFGYLYLVILLILLRRFRKGNDVVLWAIPLLFCLWANTHGSWSLGLIVFFLFVVAGLVPVSWAWVDTMRWTRPQVKKLAVAGIASIAALFANPYGWRLVYYPFDLALKQKLNISHVQEWVSIDFHEARGKVVLVFLMGIFVGAMVRKRLWHLSEILLLLFGLYMGLTYIRFLMLLGILAAPVLTKMLDFLPPYRAEVDHRWLNGIVIAAVIVAMVLHWPRESQIRESIDKNYPAGVFSFWQTNPPQGNVLNFYLWGGYLGWHDRQYKDFVDSRVDIFEYAGVLKDYLALLGTDNLQHRPDAILEKYHIRYVLFPPSDSKDPLRNGGELVYVLEHDPHWKTIYQDKACLLLEKQ